MFLRRCLLTWRSHVVQLWRRREGDTSLVYGGYSVIVTHSRTFHVRCAFDANAVLLQCRRKSTQESRISENISLCYASLVQNKIIRAGGLLYWCVDWVCVCVHTKLVLPGGCYFCFYTSHFFFPSRLCNQSKDRLGVTTIYLRRTKIKRMLSSIDKRPLLLLLLFVLFLFLLFLFVVYCFAVRVFLRRCLLTWRSHVVQLWRKATQV